MSKNSFNERVILNDIKTMDSEELLSVHGIRINEDGTVYDQAYDKSFPNVDEWIYFSSNDEDVAFEKFGYDDVEFQ